MVDLYEAVIVDTAEQFIEEVTQALVAIGEAALDILVGVLEVAGGAIGTVIAILFELLGGYRPLNAAERADAALVFGTSIDLDEVYISRESVQNDIVFGIQDFFTRLGDGDFANLTAETDSRAFVTGNLINFDPDNDFDRPHVDPRIDPRLAKPACRSNLPGACHLWSGYRRLQLRL